MTSQICKPYNPQWTTSQKNNWGSKYDIVKTKLIKVFSDTGFNNFIFKADLTITYKTSFPELTPGYNMLDYEDHVESLINNFFTKQQYTIDHCNDTYCNRHKRINETGNKTNKANHH